MSIIEAKNALDSIITKARVHLYKPIQIAEVLYRDRVHKDIDIKNLETYRSKSKKWRDIVSSNLVGNASSSSSKFQDDLFNKEAMPVNLLVELSIYNKKNKGIVEAYIYRHLEKRHIQMANTLDYCFKSSPDTFQLPVLLDMFWKESGLKRSLDKIYEIIVYSLFDLLVCEMNVQIEVSFDESKYDILNEFSVFAKKVIGIDSSVAKLKTLAKINRAGVANAADRGLDMWANFGPAIQVKHLTLKEELAEGIVTSLSADRIVIVCKDAEEKVIVSLLNQIGWKAKIQSIVLESELVAWYEEALRGKFSHILGQKLLDSIKYEIEIEFPSVISMAPFMKSRKYVGLVDSKFNLN